MKLGALTTQNKYPVVQESNICFSNSSGINQISVHVRNFNYLLLAFLHCKGKYDLRQKQIFILVLAGNFLFSNPEIYDFEASADSPHL